MTRLSLLFLLSAGLCVAQDNRDWKSVSVLTPGDKVRVSLKAGKPVTGFVRDWTPEAVTIDTTTVKRDDVKTVQRVRGGGRLKHVAIGAAIGFGGGFAIGVAAGGCRPSDFLCLPRGEVGAALGGAGLVIGAAIGAALPAHHYQLIYGIP
jgi:hypothetical protein